jgi:serine-type D-Ala-D-Ala carboxypeptidase (penicillin-binding protein 5/6)
MQYQVRRADNILRGNGSARSWLTATLVIVLALVVGAAPSFARPRRGGGAASTQAKNPPAPKVGAPATPAWIVINPATGEELSSQEPDRSGFPASMTKMMTALLVMEAVKDGQVKLADPVKTSAWASHIGGSRVYLKEGEIFSVEEMMGAMMIGSANDAATALAEHLTGSVAATVVRMNERAKELKLTGTTFHSVHGLPPGPGQSPDVTTPRDMARLATELLKYPDILRWTSTQEAPFREGLFILRNSNHLIGKFAGADGLKTGYYTQAGFNVTATATKGALRIVAVVMGAPTNSARFEDAARLLGEGFNRYVGVTVIKGGTVVDTDVKIPRAVRAFRPVAAQDVQLMLKREEKDALKTAVEIQPNLRAPLAKGQPVGALIVRLGDKEVGRTPLVTAGEVSRTAFWWLTPWK